MLTDVQDPAGLYAVLGLTPGASATAIKRAFRARAKAVHPDRHPGQAASGEFQRLVTAYKVLRDAVARTEYDTTGHVAIGEIDDEPPSAAFACSVCGVVTAQPRYVVLHEVRSYVLWARTVPVEGIFCRDCADHAGVRAAAASWVEGWWSPPGLLVTPVVLLHNLLGGTQPREANARVSIRQAQAFLARGDKGLASAAAAQAERFARTRAQTKAIAQIQTAAGAHVRLRDRWGFRLSRAFLTQLAPLLALPLTAFVLLMGLTKTWDPPPSTKRAGITVAQPSAGDIRFVAVDGLKIRQDPGDSAPVITLLDRFTALTVLAPAGDGSWVQVKTPSGITGFVPALTLYGGSGELLRRTWCEEHRGGTPAAGEVLLRHADGDHRLLIHNGERMDAVVKLKTAQGTTIVSVFVPATYHLSLAGLPEGSYGIEFATGTHYSRGCAGFVEPLKTARLPYTVTFHHVPAALMASMAGAIPEVALDDDAKPAVAIPADVFAADD